MSQQQPYTFPEAIEVSRRATTAQKDSERARRDASRELAEAERQYRMSLATEIVRLRADGTPATVAQDLAKGVKRVADLRYERDVKQGILDAAEQRAWRHTADRRDANEFVVWSKQRDMSEAHGEPQWTQRGPA